MLHDLLVNPQAYEKHIQRYAASVVTSVTYGRRVETVDEWVVRENMEAMDCKLPVVDRIRLFILDDVTRPDQVRNISILTTIDGR